MELFHKISLWFFSNDKPSPIYHPYGCHKTSPKWIKSGMPASPAGPMILKSLELKMDAHRPPQKAVETPQRRRKHPMPQRATFKVTPLHFNGKNPGCFLKYHKHSKKLGFL